MLPVRIGCDGESEIRGQPFGDLRPSPAVRSPMVGPAVVLLEDRSVARAVPREFVDALAPFGVLVRHELRAHGAVFGRPTPAPVLRLEGADGTDSREQVARLARVDQDRVQAESAETGLPVLPRRMVVKGVDVPPGFAPVLAAEEGRGFHPSIDRLRLVGGARLEVPDACDRESRAVPEFRRMRGRFERLTCSAPVHRRSPRLRAVWGRRVRGAAIPRIEDEVIDGGARHIRTGHRPLPPIRGAEAETTLLRPDGHHDTAFLDGAADTNHLQRWR